MYGFDSAGGVLDRFIEGSRLHIRCASSHQVRDEGDRGGGDSHDTGAGGRRTPPEWGAIATGLAMCTSLLHVLTLPICSRRDAGAANIVSSVVALTY